jgi:pyrrolidone-carboxylate peptidase
MTIEIEGSSRPDRRPGIAICAYDADAGWDMVEDLSGEAWSPAGARTVSISGDDPDVLADRLSDHLKNGDCRAVLLVGRAAKSNGFRMQMRAENRALDHESRLSHTGPGLARTTAPVADIVRAIKATGIPAEATSEAEADVGSYILYRVLVELADGPHTPAVGLLRTPATADENTVKRAIKAAASVMAGQMALLPRA